jgi:hypothetical protein
MVMIDYLMLPLQHGRGRIRPLSVRGSHMAIGCRIGGRGSLGCCSLLLGRVIRTTDERSRLNMHEAQSLPLPLQLRKLARMIIALDWQMLP